MSERTHTRTLAIGARHKPVIVIGAFAALMLASSSVWATDILESIPADVPGVIIFPNFQKASEHLVQFVKKVDASYDGSELDDLGVGLNLEPGTWVKTEPVVLILTRPEMDRTSLVVAYVPKDEAAIRKQLGGRVNVVRRCTDANGQHFFMMLKDGIVYAGDKRKPLWVVRGNLRCSSLAAALDEQEKKILASDDVVIRLSLDKWRNVIDPFLALTSKIVQGSVSAHQETKATGPNPAVIQWFIQGLMTFIRQMDSVVLAVSVQPDALRLNHYHRFRADESVADYLGEVQRSDVNLLSSLPNRPFLLLALASWQSPPGKSISASLVRCTLDNVEAVEAQLSAETKTKLIAELDACYGQMKGYSVMLTSPEGRLMPFQILGTYRLDDAAAGVKQVCFIQATAGDCLAGVMPGANFKGQFISNKCNGTSAFEMALNTAVMDPKIREEITKMYGKDVRYQNAQIGKHDVAYCLSEPPLSITELVSAKATGKNLESDEKVQQILKLLPERPHAAVVLDVGRALATVPTMAKAEGKHVPAGTLNVHYKGDCGPYLGWACNVQKGSISGQVAIAPDDAITAIHMAKKMGREMMQQAAVPSK